MRKRWHISASVAAFLSLDSTCNAEDKALSAAFDTLDFGTGIAELSGVETPPRLKAVGQGASGIATVLDIREANANIASKWNSTEPFVQSDFIPYAIPLLALNPVGRTALNINSGGHAAAYVISKIYVRPTPVETVEDINRRWQKEIRERVRNAELANRQEQVIQMARINAKYTPKMIDSINADDFHSNSFTVEHPFRIQNPCPNEAAAEREDCSLLPQASASNDQWKIVSIKSENPGWSDDGDLNVCETYPGLQGSGWGDAYMKKAVADLGLGSQCKITSKEDKGPLNKKYLVTCEVITEACQEIYCYRNATPPPRGTMVTTTTKQTWNLTRKSDHQITEFYDAGEGDERVQVISELELCMPNQSTHTTQSLSPNSGSQQSAPP